MSTPYRFIICDLDGTVCAHENQVSAAVRKAMQETVEANLWITLCTGRGYQTVQPLLDVVPINAPLICCNGGLIIEPTTRQVLQVQPMSLPLARKLLDLAQKEGLAFWVYLDDMETMLEYNPVESHALLRQHGEIVRQVADPIAELERPPHKLIIIAESPQDTPAVLASVKRCVADEARVLTSSPRLIEILMPGISKAQGIAWVADRLGVAQEETIAIGDGNNDLEMLNWAGLSIAMGNGTPAVKAAADWTAPPVEKDGLAVALRRFVLGS